MLGLMTGVFPRDILDHNEYLVKHKNHNV